MNKEKLNKLQAQLSGVLEKLQQYSFIGFLILVSLLYGFLFLRVNSLNNATPTTDAVDNQVQGSHVPHIDQKIVKQLQSLQDNSVSVHTLFEEARANPFQE